MNIITTAELKKRMDSPDGVVILDVRPTAMYSEWSIVGPGVTSINIQNSKLKEHGVEFYREIPKDREIVAVCAKGVSARETVGLLTQAGYQASLLMGGMSAWSEFYHVTSVVQETRYSIYQIQRPAKGCLSYFIQGGDCAMVVDAGRHIEVYTDLAKQLGVHIIGVMDTHLHADHVSGGRALAAHSHAPYYLSDEEWDTPANMRPEYMPMSHGMTLSIGDGGFSIEILKTPGHTLASMCININNRYLLSGDTVFLSGLGRPDLKGRAKEMAEFMFDTVHGAILKLPSDVMVLPSHYSSPDEVNNQGYVGAELGQIVQQNAMFAIAEKDVFADRMLKLVGATPPNYETILKINRHLVTLPTDEIATLETGPNRCAVKS